MARPLLWYAIEAAKHITQTPPVVVVDYLREQVQAFFEGENVEFRAFPQLSMLESFLLVCEEYSGEEGYLCLSSDVVLDPAALAPLREDYESDSSSVLGLVSLPEPGHKKWHFVSEEGYLRDVLVSEAVTCEERLALIVTREDVFSAVQKLERPVTLENVPADLRELQTGWTLLIKLLAVGGRGLRVMNLNTIACNVNVSADFKKAEEFVNERWA